MPAHHDPVRQESYLRQALSVGKRPLALLLGAGCPQAVKVNRGNGLEAIIPDIAGLTKCVCELEDAQVKTSIGKAVTQCEEDGCETANVERLLSHIRSLREVAGSKGQDVRGFDADALKAADQAICEEIVRLMQVELPTQDTPYHTLAKWIGAAHRNLPVEIFTTNYDLLMEQALEETRTPFFDGFVGARHPFFDPHAMDDDALPARWARLWKLHGSINWRRHDVLGVCRGAGEGFGGEWVIHPSHLKYDQARRMPYLAMVDRLRHFLRQSSSVLVTCGYSFGDAHLNEVILQGLEGNPTAIAFALLYKGVEDYPEAEAMAQQRANLSVLANDAGIIGTRQGKWMGQTVDNDTGYSAIEWRTPDPQGGSAGLYDASLKLGAFECLGEFLADLIGQDPAKGGTESG